MDPEGECEVKEVKSMRITRTRTIVVASAETALRRERVLCIAPQRRVRVTAAWRRDAEREDKRALKVRDREGGMKEPRRASNARTFSKAGP